MIKINSNEKYDVEGERWAGESFEPHRFITCSLWIFASKDDGSNYYVKE